MKYEFLPQSVPSYSATEVLATLQKSYPEYLYKEATLNPTNPRDRAVGWEVDVVNQFRASADLKEVVGERDTPSGKAMFLAKPFRITNPACLQCHSSVEVAPKTLVDKYGPANGFGWNLNEVIGAQVINTIGAKEGFSHLMWTLLQPGDAALVPSPSYPIHIYGPLFAGADIREIALGTGHDFFENLKEAWEYSWPKPRVIVMSFPHNPTTTCVDLDFMQKVVDFAREKEVVVVHDNAYAELGYDGYEPPSILQAEGAKDVAVELYSMTKSFSMAGWRVAFMVGNKDIVAALAKLKSYLDYGTFQPVQIAATVTLNEAQAYPKEALAIYQARRDTLCGGLNRIGWPIEPPKGTMFCWAPIPEPYLEMGSVEFAKMLVTEAQVAVSPGVGFGPGGEGFVRFALIENEQRALQAVRNLKRALVKLDAPA
jgi:alanine-synthesizing transaminase